MMFRHHPAFAETGELEIAQRQAVAYASACAGDDIGTARIKAIVTAYMNEMRRVWQPEAIEIEEGDHIVVKAAGQVVEIHASDQGYYVAHPST